MYIVYIIIVVSNPLKSLRGEVVQERSIKLILEAFEHPVYMTDPVYMTEELVEQLILAFILKHVGLDEFKD